MFVCKERFRKLTKKIKLNAGGHEVKQVSIVKILGFKIQHNLQNSSQVNGLISNLNNRLYNIRKMGNKTIIKTRKMLVKSIVIGKLNYTPPCWLIQPKINYRD